MKDLSPTIVGTIQPGKATTIQRFSNGALEIQTFDSYAYQRELSIEPFADLWAVIAYKHPFRPSSEAVVSRSVAMRLVARVLLLTSDYPRLLWNEQSSGYGRHEGFVHFHDKLLAGATPSVRLLP